MSLVVSRWPFLPAEQRTLEQNERWWAECYTPSPADVPLRGIPHSVIVSGGPGSGKSIALQALEREEANRWLMIHYPIDHWPGETHAWSSAHNHLGQIMADVAATIKTLLTHRPDQLTQLSPIDLEYLRWLIEKYNGERAFRRWVNTINVQLLWDLLKEPFVDLYETDTDLSDVQGQIEELVTLSQRLGFAGIAILVDINQAETLNEVILEKIKALFGWLTPLQFDGFAIKAALPQHIVQQAHLIERARGRIHFASQRWSVTECRELSNRHLQVATSHQLTSIQDLISETLLNDVENKIKALYNDEPSPLAWLRLTAIALDQYITCGHQILATKQQLENLIRTYFTKHVPLKFDRGLHGVWRGPQLIILDEQPFSFLEILWQYRNAGETNYDRLLKIAGSQGNLNTIASRLRKKIEPVPNQPIYIRSSHSHGYWLENIVEIP